MQHTDETPSCASTCLPETPQSGSDLPLILPSKEEKWKFWDSIFDMHLRWGSSFAWSPPNSSFLRSLEEPSWGSDEQELEVGEQVDSDKPELLEHGLGLLALEDAAQSEQFGTEDESEERFNFFESDMGSTPISEDPEDISELPIITNGFFQDTNEGASPEEVRRRQIDDLRERLQEDPRYQYYRIMRPGDEETVLEELDYLHERTVTVNEGTFCVTLNNTLVYSVDDPDEVEDSHATPVEPPRQKPWGFSGLYQYILRSSDGDRVYITHNVGNGNTTCNGSAIPESFDFTQLNRSGQRVYDPRVYRYQHIRSKSCPPSGIRRCEYYPL